MKNFFKNQPEQNICHLTCTRILGILGIWVWAVIGASSVWAIEMDELMDDVMDGVRQETRQTIQQQVKQETREVLIEEQVIPSGTFSGTYFGTVTFGPGDTDPFRCTLSVGTANSPIPFAADCFGTEDDPFEPQHTFTISGSIQNGSFSFTITETTSICAGNRTSSGSGTISGKGEPGTTFTGNYGGTCGDPTGSFSMTKT